MAGSSWDQGPALPTRRGEGCGDREEEIKLSAAGGRAKQGKGIRRHKLPVGTQAGRGGWEGQAEGRVTDVMMSCGDRRGTRVTERMVPPLTTLCASHRRPTTRTWVKRTRAAPAGGTWQEGLAVAPGHRSGPGARLHGNGLWVGRGLWEALSKPLTLCVFSSPSPLTLGMLHSLGVRAAAIPNPVPQHVKALTRGPATATALQRESPGSRVPGRPRPGCLLCPAPGERGPLFRGPRACQGRSAPSFVLTPRTQWSGPGPGWRAACGTPPHKPGAPTSRTRAASVGGGRGLPKLGGGALGKDR